MNLLRYESVECTAYRTHAANHRFVEAFPAGNPYTYTVITNDTENQMNHKNKRRFDSRIIAGILFILVGVLILIDRANVIVFSIFDILALVAVLGGSIQIIQAQSRKDYREGTMVDLPRNMVLHILSPGRRIRFRRYLASPDHCTGNRTHLESNGFQ
jgi:hypothetical protein